MSNIHLLLIAELWYSCVISKIWQAGRFNFCAVLILNTSHHARTSARPKRRNRDFIVHQNSISRASQSYISKFVPDPLMAPKPTARAHVCRPICPKREIIGFKFLWFVDSLSLSLFFIPFLFCLLFSSILHFYLFFYLFQIRGSSFSVFSFARGLCSSEMASIFVSSFLPSNLSQPVCQASNSSSSPFRGRKLAPALETASKNDYSEINNNDITYLRRSIRAEMVFIGLT